MIFSDFDLVASLQISLVKHACLAREHSCRELQQPAHLLASTPSSPREREASWKGKFSHWSIYAAPSDGVPASMELRGFPHAVHRSCMFVNP